RSRHALRRFPIETPLGKKLDVWDLVSATNLVVDKDEKCDQAQTEMTKVMKNLSLRLAQGACICAEAMPQRKHARASRSVIASLRLFTTRQSRCASASSTQAHLLRCFTSGFCV